MLILPMSLTVSWSRNQPTWQMAHICLQNTLLPLSKFGSIAINSPCNNWWNNWFTCKMEIHWHEISVVNKCPPKNSHRDHHCKWDYMCITLIITKTLGNCCRSLILKAQGVVQLTQQLILKLKLGHEIGVMMSWKDTMFRQNPSGPLCKVRYCEVMGNVLFHFCWEELDG